MAYIFMFGVVPLPITPGALSIKTPSMNKTVTLINEGEINIPKDRGLREISFEFLLPQVQKYPFATYQLGSYTASVMIPLLNEWAKTKIPFRFIVVRTSPKGKILYFTYIKCLIEDYTYDEDAEAHGLDVMCSITLKEYRDYGTKSAKIKEVKNSDGSTTKTVSQTNTRSTTGKTVKSSVKTQEGDTLANIAKKETGSFDNYAAVAKANNVAVPEIDNNDYISTPLDDILDPTSPLGDKPLGNFVETPVKLTSFQPTNNTLQPINFEYLRMQDTFNQYLERTSPLNDIKVPSTVNLPFDNTKISPGLSPGSALRWK